VLLQRPSDEHNVVSLCPCLIAASEELVRETLCKIGWIDSQLDPTVAAVADPNRCVIDGGAALAARRVA
jgi:hypothetical protein